MRSRTGDDEDEVTILVRRSDVRYLLETPRPFYRNCDESKRILDALRRAMANGHAEGRY